MTTVARKTIVELIDDIDGSKAVDTINFSLQGVNYEIDLSEENVDKLHREFGLWIASARRVGGRARRSSGAPTTAKETAKIREWARENGYRVSDRGRIAADIREAYHEANGS